MLYLQRSDHFPQKSPMVRGSFAEMDLEHQASYESSTPCRMYVYCIYANTYTYTEKSIHAQPHVQGHRQRTDTSTNTDTCLSHTQTNRAHTQIHVYHIHRYMSSTYTDKQITHTDKQRAHTSVSACVCG